MNKKPKAILPFFDENNPTMRLDLFTWPEVDEYLRHCKGIILPIGSTEQHGPTGAIGTDALTAQAVAYEVSKRTGVLVTPTQPYGMAEHHLGFAGTMSLRPETLLELVHDLLISLSMHGFEKIFIIKGKVFSLLKGKNLGGEHFFLLIKEKTASGGPIFHAAPSGAARKMYKKILVFLIKKNKKTLNKEKILVFLIKKKIQEKTFSLNKKKTFFP